MNHLITLQPSSRSSSLWPFISLQLIAFFLLFSWFWPTTQALWLHLDYQVFNILNSSLTLHRSWQILWALCNCRPFDGVVLILFLLSVTRPNWVFAQEHTKKILLLLIATSIIALMIRYGMKYLFNIKRASPSLILPHAIRLHELVPFLPAKDQSHNSFPGDHASLTLVWWGIVLLYTHKNHWRFTASAAMIVILLPRLIAGAHWLTDDVIGGLFVALLAIAWTCFSPLSKVILRLDCTLLAPRWMKKLFVYASKTKA